MIYDDEDFESKLLFTDLYLKLKEIPLYIPPWWRESMNKEHIIKRKFFLNENHIDILDKLMFACIDNRSEKYLLKQCTFIACDFSEIEDFPEDVFIDECCFIHCFFPKGKFFRSNACSHNTCIACYDEEDLTVLSFT